MAAGGGGGGGGGGGEDVVELKVSSSTSEDILVVHVSRSCTLREIKATIGQELRRPELVEVAKFVRILPNGETVPIHDGQQLGSRKALCLDGAPLVPAPPERDAATLEDFDENDRSWSITSPRSLRACASEGILPEELFHTPLDEYDDVEPSPILAQLQHDFFDAYRSDLLRIARKARAALIAEDGGQSNTESSTWSVVGPGGQWSGPLSAQSGHEEYASTYAFLSGQRKLVTLEKVYQQPLRLTEAGEHQHRWNMDTRNNAADAVSPRSIPSSEESVEDTSDRIESKAAQLKCLSRGSNERVQGVVIHTEAVAVHQRAKAVERLDEKHHNDRRHTNRKVEIAEAQKTLVDKVHELEVELQDRVDVAHIENQGPWTTLEQQQKSDAAAKRREYWETRREFTYLQQLQQEQRRNAAQIKWKRSDLKTSKSIAVMKDRRKLHYARNWLDRRLLWAANHEDVQRNTQGWKTAVMSKQAEASARVQDQRMRFDQFNDYKRALRELRDAFRQMTAARELERKNYRRRAVAGELERLAVERQSSSLESKDNLGPKMASRLSMSASSSCVLSVSSSHTGLVHSGKKTGPRFNWGRFGAGSVLDAGRTRLTSHGTLSSATSTPDLHDSPARSLPTVNWSSLL